MVLGATLSNSSHPELTQAPERWSVDLQTVPHLRLCQYVASSSCLLFGVLRKVLVLDYLVPNLNGVIAVRVHGLDLHISKAYELSASPRPDRVLNSSLQGRKYDLQPHLCDDVAGLHSDHGTGYAQALFCKYLCHASFGAPKTDASFLTPGNYSQCMDWTV